jgi:uncharacterized protein (DUF488 family)
MKLFTIGFTKKSAETFFTRIARAGVKKLIDVRLNNVSQLAGFTKRDDLRYFTRAICDIEYVNLMQQRRIEETLSPEMLADGCLLCSEEKPHHCHRRLVAEYLKGKWDAVEIEHIP